MLTESEKQEIQQQVQQGVACYKELIRQNGLEPDDKLVTIMTLELSTRMVQEYEAKKDLAVKIKMMQQHQQREGMNEITESGGRMRLIICPLLAAFCVLMAWLNFSHANLPMGLIFSVGALAFLLMLVLGAIFDRPTGRK